MYYWYFRRTRDTSAEHLFGPEYCLPFTGVFTRFWKEALRAVSAQAAINNVAKYVLCPCSQHEDRVCGTGSFRVLTYSRGGSRFGTTTWKNRPFLVGTKLNPGITDRNRTAIIIEARPKTGV